MSRGRILVVDDSLIDLDLLKIILTRDGYEVLPANSGTLALTAIAVRAPDLVLLDLRMPGMDGLEVLRRLGPPGRDEGIPPVIIVSGVTDAAERLEGLRLGAVDFLSKPFDIAELLARVATQVELSRARRRIEAHRAELERTVEERTREISRMRQLFEQAFRNNPTLMAISDPETGRIIDINNAWLARMDAGHADPRGKTSVDLGLFASQAERDRLVRLLLDPDHPEPIEIDTRDPLGQPLFGQITGEIIAVGADRYLFTTIQDLTRQHELALRLEHEATHDPLTGAYNRQYANAYLTRETATAARLDYPLALLMLDLDHFKDVNDTLGHLVGDRILCALMGRLAERIRRNDLLARWGGDEVILALPGTDREGGYRLAETLRDDIARHPFDDVGAMTLSIGLAVWRPDETVAAWLGRADRALYAAKEGGRNQVRVDE